MADSVSDCTAKRGSCQPTERFSQLMTGLQAAPKVHIYYKREAYVSDDDTVRVTLDRDVFAEPHFIAQVKT